MVCGKVCKPPAAAARKNLRSSSPAGSSSLGFAPSLGAAPADALSLAVTPGATPGVLSPSASVSPARSSPTRRRLSPSRSPTATDRRVAAMERRVRKRKATRK